MSILTERTLVHCSVNQASRHLARYFKARGNSDGEVARLSLRAEVPVPGSKAPVRLERTAIATLVPRHKPGEMMPHYAVTWAPESAGLYPTFSGDLAIESAQRRTSAALGGKTYAHHPYTQRDVAQAAIELESIWALLDRVANDWANGVDHGPLWPAKIVAAKQHAVDGARRVVDLATKIAGASSLYRKNELERLYRDVRSGPFHPPTSDVAHDLIGRSYLGVLGG